MNKTVVISGVTPGPSGVGRVMEYLIGYLLETTFLYPPSARSISIKDALSSLNFKLFFLKAVDVFFIFLKKKLYGIRIHFLNNRDIIIVHPQSIGYERVQKLIEKNSVSIYLMDNSFFCIKSYNHLDSTKKECLLCLDLAYENAVKQGCLSFPLNYSYDEYFLFLNFLKANKNKIKFIAQNLGQIELLKHQFGNDVSFTEIGLLTSDMFEEQKHKLVRVKKKYDVVFHGDEVPAKGSWYILNLASRLPELTFLFPFYTDSQEVPDNVDFISMRWNSGLKANIRSSKITICPSMWSAPIEGSVVKTLNLGVALGVYDADHSFSQEIPDDAVFRLTGVLDQDVVLLREFISSKYYKLTSVNGKKYINKKIKNMISNYEVFFKT